MKLPIMTTHAQSRLQQRGIAPEILPLLFEFGSSMHDHRGAEVLYLTGYGRTRMRKAAGSAKFKQLESSLDTYAVIGSDGQVITVGHRTRRIHRP